MKELN